jgi:hypothetical protein
MMTGSASAESVRSCFSAGMAAFAFGPI